MLLDHPWPPDLHPAEAGFKTWTETILRRMGYWDDPTRLDNLTADEFLRIETAGVTSLADLIGKGNAAIARMPTRLIDPATRSSLPSGAATSRPSCDA